MADPQDIKAALEAMSGTIQSFGSKASDMMSTIQASADKLGDVTKGVKEWQASMEQIVSTMSKLISFQSQAVATQEALVIGGTARNQQLSVENETQKEKMALIQEDIDKADVFTKKLERWLEIRRDALEIEHQHLATAYKNIDAVGRALSNVESLGPKILNAIPGGGMIGFLLMGATAGAEWKADAQQVIQQFDVVGGKAGEFAGQITRYTRDFQADSKATAAEIKGIAAAFAETGIRAEEVFGKKSFGVLEAMGLDQQDLLESTLAMDKLMEVASGTFAKLSGSAVSELGNTLEDATQAITGYGMAARDAGLNTMEFLNSVMQNSQQLKLYHVQLSDVAAMTLKMTEINTKQGMDARFAHTVASAGMGQMGQGIQGMSEGLAAFIGQRVMNHMAATNGGTLKDSSGNNVGLDPISALVQMRRGGRDLNDHDQRQFMGQTIQQLGELAARVGQDGSKFEYFLQKQGFGAEGAHAIAQLHNSGKMQNGELTEKQQAEINKALQSEAEKTSEMATMMKEIKVAIAEVSNGLLGLIINMLKLIWQSLEYGLAQFSNAFHLGVSDEELGTMSKNYGKTQDAVKDSLALIVKGLSDVFKAAGTGAKTIPGLTDGSWNLLHEDEKELSKKEKLKAQLRHAVNEERDVALNDVLRHFPGMTQSQKVAVTSITDDGKSFYQREHQAELAKLLGKEVAAALKDAANLTFAKHKKGVIQQFGSDHPGFNVKVLIEEVDDEIKSASGGSK